MFTISFEPSASTPPREPLACVSSSAAADAPAVGLLGSSSTLRREAWLLGRRTRHGIERRHWFRVWSKVSVIFCWSQSKRLRVSRATRRDSAARCLNGVAAVPNHNVVDVLRGLQIDLTRDRSDRGMRHFLVRVFAARGVDGELRAIVTGLLASLLFFSATPSAAEDYFREHEPARPAAMRTRPALPWAAARLGRSRVMTKLPPNDRGPFQQLRSTSLQAYAGQPLLRGSSTA